MKRGQAGEGAAGDAGDGIVEEISAMEIIRDKSVRGREKQLEWNEVATREGSLCKHKRSPQIKEYVIDQNKEEKIKNKMKKWNDKRQW